MGTDIKYRRILHAVASTPWAMEPQRIIDVMEVLSFKALGGEMTPEEIQAYTGIDAAARPRSERRGAVAVIGIRGIIEHRIEMIDNISGPGGTSIQEFRRRFRDALASDSVSSILLDVDSPGGSVDGVEEMAAEIFESRGEKPIVAIANTQAASAAYYLASQADELYVTPSGTVGSIGVFAAHSDISERLEREGEKVTLVHAGVHKVDGNPFEPLTEEARDHMQQLIDGYYEDFVSAVARGRGVSIKDVRTGFGQGRSVRAPEAMSLGMVDGVEDFDSVASRLMGAPSSSGPRAWAPTHAVEFEFI